MLDLAYVAGTAAFFGLMLLFVRGCEALGREPSDAQRETTR
jgi:hypothetical protein